MLIAAFFLSIIEHCKLVIAFIMGLADLVLLWPLDCLFFFFCFVMNIFSFNIGIVFRVIFSEFLSHFFALHLI